jgi:hypothetical protein
MRKHDPVKFFLKPMYVEIYHVFYLQGVFIFFEKIIAWKKDI